MEKDVSVSIYGINLHLFAINMFKIFFNSITEWYFPREKWLWFDKNLYSSTRYSHFTLSLWFKFHLNTDKSFWQEDIMDYSKDRSGWVLCTKSERVQHDCKIRIALNVLWKARTWPNGCLSKSLQLNMFRFNILHRFHICQVVVTSDNETKIILDPKERTI